MRHSPAIFLLVALSTAGLASAQTVDWPSERPPGSLPAREASFPVYQIRTLPNGLQVVAVSHHEQPAVSLRLIVRAGGSQDPATRPGVAYVAASLLDQGTTTKSAEQIASTIDSIGGAIGAGA
jgi:zinc protease